MPSPFTDIDSRREAAGITQYALCQRADVHPTTYHRLLKDQTGERGTMRTLNKLEHALDQLIREKAA